VSPTRSSPSGSASPFIPPNFHVASIIDKLDATGRTDAVAHAARLGVIEL